MNEMVLLPYALRPIRTSSTASIVLGGARNAKFYLVGATARFAR